MPWILRNKTYSNFWEVYFLKSAALKISADSLKNNF
jgi:hypothetical protein